MAWLARPFLDAFERRYDYNVDYLREVAGTSMSGFVRFSCASMMSNYHQGVPLEAWFAAKIVGARHEDCGPCVQLVVRMAEEAGVSPKVLRAIIEGNDDALTPDAALGLAYARSVLERDLMASDQFRTEVRERWGDEALLSLAFALTSARLFPTLKYALGHGRSCSRVVVSGEELHTG
ncbi:MAG: hypothetical protein KIT72_06690 [Polyangiaceae bacterium]|nr:hypothetical protein [Polyangiaceae bacterium]MCW5790090.1 hypothetical protein [Polyangiaceae bacterium]